MRIKICGITEPSQGLAIAASGATALGFIFVPGSPREVTAERAREIIGTVGGTIDFIGVFAGWEPEKIEEVVNLSGLTGVQLHGEETPEYCQNLKNILPGREIIKALRIRNRESLERATEYYSSVHTLLLDAYHPTLLGGTGHTLNPELLEKFRPPLPWFLAGGLNPENILEAIDRLNPDGVDLSSGVERAPGDKDLEKVARLFERLTGIKD